MDSVPAPKHKIIKENMDKNNLLIIENLKNENIVESNINYIINQWCQNNENDYDYEKCNFFS